VRSFVRSLTRSFVRYLLETLFISHYLVLSIIQSFLFVPTDVPQSPLLTAVSHQRMISLNWTTLDITDDVGLITHYIIQLKNLTSVKNIQVPSSECAYNLTFLRPYTNFTIKMQAVTRVGHGLWSSLERVRTQIAGK